MIFDSFKVVYNSGGYGTIDIFYKETLVIKSEGISYKKEWEINKHQNDDEYMFYPSESKRDYSWKVKFNTHDDFNRLAEQLRDAEFEIDAKSFACDGDTTIVEIIDIINDQKLIHKNSFSLCCNEAFRRKLKLLLADYLPKNIIPEFLIDYDEEEEENE